MQQENINLSRKLNELDQYSRKINVIIHGIPPKKGENPRETTKKFTSEIIGIQIADHEINAVHRLKVKKGMPPFIVCLNNLDTKEELIQWSRENKKEVNPAPYYINEHLSKYTESLLKEARKREVTFAWSQVEKYSLEEARNIWQK